MTTEKQIETGLTNNETKPENETQGGEAKKKIPRRLCAICGVSEHEHNTFASDKMHEFKPRPKGFAAMSKDKVSAIASRGGKAAHVAGTAHKFTHDEAVAAGRKGGKSRTEKHGPVGVRSTLPCPVHGELHTAGKCTGT